MKCHACNYYLCGECTVVEKPREDVIAEFSQDKIGIIWVEHVSPDGKHHAVLRALKPGSEAAAQAQRVRPVLGSWVVFKFPPRLE